MTEFWCRKIRGVIGLYRGVLGRFLPDTRLLFSATLAIAVAGCGMAGPAEHEQETLVSLPETGNGKTSKSALVSGLDVDTDLLSDLTDEMAIAISEAAQRTLETAPDGVERVWFSRDQGVRWSITPTSTHFDTGVLCRDYLNIIELGAKRGTATAHACRKGNGRWELVPGHR